MPNNRGFCVLGMLEGTYNLYLSSSQAATCPAYLLDDYANETLRLETELNHAWRDLTDRMWDKRKKLPKRLIKAIPDLSDMMSNAMENNRCLMEYVENERELMRMVWRWFTAEHKERFQAIRKRKMIEITRYWQTISMIQTALQRAYESEPAEEQPPSDGHIGVKRYA